MGYIEGAKDQPDAPRGSQCPREVLVDRLRWRRAWLEWQAGSEPLHCHRLGIHNCASRPDTAAKSLPSFSRGLSAAGSLVTVLLSRRRPIWNVASLALPLLWIGRGNSATPDAFRNHRRDCLVLFGGKREPLPQGRVAHEVVLNPAQHTVIKACPLPFLLRHRAESLRTEQNHPHRIISSRRRPQTPSERPAPGGPRAAGTGHACGYALANKGHDTRRSKAGSAIGRSPAPPSTRPWRRTGSRTSGGSERWSTGVAQECS
jgi:hypothetical protein